MRNLLSLALIFGICMLGAAERFQDRYADLVSSTAAAPAQPIIGSQGRDKIPRAEVEPASLDSSADRSAKTPPIEPPTQSNAQQPSSVSWSEAESFLERIETQTQDLDAKDVDKFNALIQEAGRITNGLPPELRPQFKSKLFTIIDKTFELPPLPEDVVYEFEKK